MSADRFPLDFETLTRGVFLSASEVDKATLSDPDDHLRWRKVLALKEEIEGYFEEVRGDAAVVVCEKDGLRILTHQEQAAYAPRRVRKGVKMIMRGVKDAAAVNMAELTDDEQKQHQRNLHVMSWKAQQLMKPAPPHLNG